MYVLVRHNIIYLCKCISDIIRLSFVDRFHSYFFHVKIFLQTWNTYKNFNFIEILLTYKNARYWKCTLQFICIYVYIDICIYCENTMFPKTHLVNQWEFLLQYPPKFRSCFATSHIIIFLWSRTMVSKCDPRTSST